MTFVQLTPKLANNRPAGFSHPVRSPGPTEGKPGGLSPANAISEVVPSQHRITLDICGHGIVLES